MTTCARRSENLCCETQGIAPKLRQNRFKYRATTALQTTRKWGKIALVGEGGTLGLSPSPDLIHDQKTVYGSWVTSIWLMEDLVERIVRWKMHPEDLVTNRFPLEKANEAYALIATGKSGKVAVVFDEELK
jgi:threonine dehydrogenase-like Zn-dependent dehydrogenase